MIFKIIISDREFNIVDEIQDISSGLRWDYNRVGGCGTFSLKLPERFCESTLFGSNYNVVIKRKNPTTKAYDTWYQGRIENRVNSVNGTVENLSITGTGYQSQLKDILVSRDYSSTEASLIVKDILDNDVVGNTDITYNGGDLEATSFTPDTFEAKGSALDVFQKLSDIVGSREWGVDANRKFYFKARSTTIGFKYFFGHKVQSYKVDNSSQDIINRVVIVGGDVSGSPYTSTHNDLNSQAKFGIRAVRKQNSGIVTSAVATQYADSLFSEFSDAIRRATLKVTDEVQIESTIPIPLLFVQSREILWNELNWDDFLWAGQDGYQINRVQYSLDDNGTLNINFDLGRLRPDISEDLNQIEYQINQLVEGGL